MYAKEYSVIDGDVFDDTPAANNVYLVLFFEFLSKTKDAYVDGYKTVSKFLLNNPDGYLSISGNLYEGKRVRGYIAYEVATDWQEFEISYDDGIFTSHEEAKYKFTKEEVANQNYVYDGDIFVEYVPNYEKVTPVNTKISNNTWEVMVLEIAEVKQIGNGILATEAEEGFSFLIFALDVKNISTETNYFNILYFYYYVDDYKTATKSFLDKYEEYSNNFGELDPNKRTKGFIAMLVPEEWECAEVMYNDGNEVLSLVITSSLLN